MAAKKIRDLVVVTGEYRNRDGETKKRYQNVGAMMKSDDGDVFIMLNAHFNPAGIARREGSESILISCFEQRDQQTQQSQPAPAQEQRKSRPAQEPYYPEDDEIPF